LKAGRATVLELAPAGLRKTTKNESSGPISSGTTVSPPSVRYETASVSPVSALQISGSLPVTRKRASTFSARGLRLFRK
jgi:hypothetical protein